MRNFLVCSALLVGCCAVGCGKSDGRPAVYPVQGKVLVKGQAAGGAKVTFFPVSPEPSSGGVKVAPPTGTVDASGVYHLETFKPEDGAPAGDYKVTVVWLEDPPPNAQGIFDQKDRLQGRYADPKTTQLQAKIEKGGGDVPPFELK
jgi:hypothetical protein